MYSAAGCRLSIALRMRCGARYFEWLQFHLNAIFATFAWPQNTFLCIWQ